MAQDWSHTEEAYANAYENTHELDHDYLATAFAEWNATKKDSGFSNYKHDTAKRRALRMPHDILADAVWEYAQNNGTSDNGGFNAWLCPDGCHTVSFDRNNAK